MPRNLWIGHPGRLREIEQAATSWERGAELGVGQFTSLGGQVTTHAPRRAARKLKLSFDRLPEADAAHLDRLARRVDGPGPIAVLDPVTRNLLDPLQASGRSGGGSGQWAVAAGSGTLVPSTTDLPNTWKWRPAAVGDRLAWTLRPWPGFPVAPGATVRFTLPTAWRVTPGTAELGWLAADGRSLSTTSATGPTVTGTAPPGAAFVVPAGSAGASGGDLMLSGAVLTADDAYAPRAPRELLAAAAAAGKAPLSQWQADGTTLSEDAGYAVLTLPANTSGTLRWRNGDAPGFPVAPGEQVALTVSRELRARAANCYLTWFSAAGTFTGFADTWMSAAAPPSAAYVQPALQFDANSAAFSARVGATGLRAASPDADLPGDGCPPMAITAYTDTPGRPLPHRSISLDLTEVTGATG
ncbi:hypothetical protein [Streptomyces silvensis]|uniref:Uncharacterized protein n=1 Tax=Streptomyces silvensis TaxID=1765722 RepID=A0A0W7X3S5_9ACTN|nr:hypothetical protein [Streptomyces silvensis]KUF17534.1 hypothetical protein AT728_08890 [Streptomyces silvensis]